MSQTFTNNLRWQDHKLSIFLGWCLCACFPCAWKGRENQRWLAADSSELVTCTNWKSSPIDCKTVSLRWYFNSILHSGLRCKSSQTRPKGKIFFYFLSFVRDREWLVWNQRKRSGISVYKNCYVYGWSHCLGRCYTYMHTAWFRKVLKRARKSKLACCRLVRTCHVFKNFADWSRTVCDSISLSVLSSGLRCKASPTPHDQTLLINYLY